jgi:hypothetical protein
MKFLFRFELPFFWPAAGLNPNPDKPELKIED